MSTTVPTSEEVRRATTLLQVFRPGDGGTDLSAARPGANFADSKAAVGVLLGGTKSRRDRLELAAVDRGHRPAVDVDFLMPLVPRASQPTGMQAAGKRAKNLCLEWSGRTLAAARQVSGLQRTLALGLCSVAVATFAAFGSLAMILHRATRGEEPISVARPASTNSVTSLPGKFNRSLPPRVAGEPVAVQSTRAFSGIVECVKDGRVAYGDVPCAQGHGRTVDVSANREFASPRHPTRPSP